MRNYFIGAVFGVTLGVLGAKYYVENVVSLSDFMDHIVEICPVDKKTVVAVRDGEWTITCQPEKD